MCFKVGAVRSPGYIAAILVALALGWDSVPSAPAHAHPQSPGDVDGSLFAPAYLTRLRESTSIMPNNELRALWVVRDALTSPESVERMIDFAVQTRTHLLFVQVRGRADTFYRSAIDPPASILEAPLADFDPLSYLVTLAHRNGIAVHAWINVFLVWSDMSKTPPSTHLVARHPEWLLTDASGVRMDRMASSKWKKAGVEGWFASPGSAAMRAHMARVVRELVSGYAIDGVHLDYIRYPNRIYSYDPEDRAAFAVKWGVDPAETAQSDRAQLQRILGGTALALIDSLASSARIANVDSMVVAIRVACGDKVLSAAVVADPNEARRDRGQDWGGWVHKGWVDFVVPMAYNFPPLELEHRAVVYNRMLGRDRWLMGLGVFDGRDEYLAEAVAVLREVGITGFSIFSYNVLEREHYGVALMEEAVLPPDTSSGEDDVDE